MAFVSLASNLVPGDNNGVADIFVSDRKSGVIQRLSLRSDGEQGNGWSYQPAISADGRLVAFTSLSSNLGEPGPSAKPAGIRQANVFLHNLDSGKTELVSRAGDGQPGNGWSDWPSLSADGRYIAFVSLADNLEKPGAKGRADDNGASDVFVFDRQSGGLQRISVAQDGSPANGWSLRPAISANGRYVAFLSYATNLTGGTPRGSTPRRAFRARSCTCWCMTA